MRNINRFEKQKFSFGCKDIVKDAVLTLVICFLLYLPVGEMFVFVLFIPFFVAAIIGDIVRKYTRPDVISTRGGALNVLDKKLYWEFGPQIGAIILLVFFFLVFAQNSGSNSSSQIPEKKDISTEESSVKYRD